MFTKKDRQKLVAEGIPTWVTADYLKSIRNTRLWNSFVSLYGSEPVLRRFHGEDSDSTNNGGDSSPPIS